MRNLEKSTTSIRDWLYKNQGLGTSKAERDCGNAEKVGHHRLQVAVRSTYGALRMRTRTAALNWCRLPQIWRIPRGRGWKRT